MTGDGATAGQPILWLELFFDLVAVAAMVVLATALEEHPGWGGIGVFAVTFAAIWTTWSSYALYVNVASEQAERRTILLGMAGIAVMAASLVDLEAHADAFAVAFVLCRLFTVRASLRTGRLLAAWPIAQIGGFTTPWIVSLWVPAPGRYWLWALALTVDLLSQIRRRDAAETLAQIEARVARDRERGRVRPTLVAAPVREHHLVERFGTFVIIVLGESVLQLVRAASEVPWDAAMWSTAFAGFGVIVTLWRLTFAYGFSGAPGVRGGGGLGSGVDLRIAMPTHLVSTGSLVVLAAALGEMVRHPEHHAEGVWPVIAAAALGVHLLVAVVSALLSGSARRWVWGWGVPAVVAVAVVGATGRWIPVSAYVWLLLVPLAWLVMDARAPRAAAAGVAGSAAAGPGGSGGGAPSHPRT